MNIKKKLRLLCFFPPCIFLEQNFPVLKILFQPNFKSNNEFISKIKKNWDFCDNKLCALEKNITRLCPFLKLPDKVLVNDDADISAKFSWKNVIT